jgi:hypothetical protein
VKIGREVGLSGISLLEEDASGQFEGFDRHVKTPVSGSILDFVPDGIGPEIELGVVVTRLPITFCRTRRPGISSLTLTTN